MLQIKDQITNTHDINSKTSLFWCKTVIKLCFSSKTYIKHGKIYFFAHPLQRWYPVFFGLKLLFFDKKRAIKHKTFLKPMNFIFSWTTFPCHSNDISCWSISDQKISALIIFTSTGRKLNRKRELDHKPLDSGRLLDNRTCTRLD